MNIALTVITGLFVLVQVWVVIVGLSGGKSIGS
jgi:hypothetical protein